MTDYVTGRSTVVTWWPGDPEGTTSAHVTNHAVRADRSEGSRAACGGIALERVEWDRPWNPEDDNACPSCVEHHGESGA